MSMTPRRGYRKDTKGADCAPSRNNHHQIEVAATAPQSWRERQTPLKVDVAGAGRQLDLAEFLSLTATTALVVVVDGELVHEQYFGTTRADDRLLGYSATKSALALLTGVAVRAGQLPDLDARVVDYVPELLGGGYDRVTVRQVLTMTSGVGWVEDYRDPSSQASKLLDRWRSGTGGVRDCLRAIPAGHPPGSRFAYCSPDSMVLDWVRERATGLSFGAAIAHLWQLLGCEHDATVGLDSPAEVGGVAMAAAALSATARDWARLGVVQVDGSWRREQVVDPSWVTASSQPERPFLAPGRLPSTITTHAGFGFHWWPLDPDGSRVMADGMRGQFVYVDRPRRTVVVKTSDWLYDDAWLDRQYRDLCYLALPAISAAAASAVAA